MNILERVTLAARILAGKEKLNPLAPLNIRPGWSGGADDDTVTQPRLDEPEANMAAFEAEPWVYRAVNANATAISTSPFVVEELKTVEGEKQWVESTQKDLNRLVSRPNSEYTIEELSAKTSIALDLVGDAYIGRDPDTTRNEDEEWWWHNPVNAEVKANKYTGVQQYVFKNYGKTVVLDFDDVAHIRTPNPLHPFYGFSAVRAAIMPILTLYHDRRYLKNHYKNNALPGSVVLSDGPNPGEDAIREARAAWNRLYGGSDNPSRVAFLFNGTKLEKITPPLKDLVMYELRKMSREEIAACFGVPPILMGIVEDANRSNSDDQMRMWYENIVIPRQKLIARSLTIQLVQPRFGDNYRIRFDNSDRDFLQDDQTEKATRLISLYRGGIITRNEARVDLGKDPDPEGDEYYTAPSPFAGAFGDNQGGQDNQDNQDDNGDEGKGAMPSASLLMKWGVKNDASPRLKLWQAHNARLLRYENRFEKIAVKYWDGQLDRILAKINKATSGGKFTTAIKLWVLKDNPIDPDDADNLFDIGAENQALRDAIDDFITEVVSVSGQEALDTFNINFSFNVSNPEVYNVIAGALNRSERINNATYEDVKRLLNEAYDDGIGIDEIERRLRDLFKSYYKVKPGDPDMITRGKRFARTEMNGIVNGASMNAYQQSGVEKKEWLATQDSATRDVHAYADGEVVPITQPFMKTGEPLMYPGDPSGSAGNVINCRCDILPVIE